MQAVEPVLQELHAALDARILESTDILDRDTKILAFLRRCVAEEVQYINYKSQDVPRPPEESFVDASFSDSGQSDSNEQFARAAAKPTVLKFVSFEEGEKGSSLRNGGGDGSNRRVDGIRVIEESSPTAAHIAATADKAAPASLEDILQHARQLRLAHEKLAPGADGSRLGGSAGRSSASSHASARGTGSVSSRPHTHAPTATAAARGAKSAPSKLARAVMPAAGVKANDRRSADLRSKKEADRARNSAAQPKDSAATTHGRALAASSREKMDEPPPAGSAAASRAASPAPSYAFARCLRSQLELLLLPSSKKHWEPKRALKEAANAAVPSAELLESQAALLTQLVGYPALPPSIAFECLQDIRLRSAEKSPLAHRTSAEEKEAWLDDAEDAVAAQARRDCYAAANASRIARDEYQKHWRLRLERAPMSSLSPTERRQVVSIWYRLHICSQVFEDAQRRLRGVHGGGTHAPAQAASHSAFVLGGAGSECGTERDARQQGKSAGGVGVGVGAGGLGGAGCPDKDKVPTRDPDVERINGLLQDLVLSFPAAPMQPPAATAAANKHMHMQAHSQGSGHARAQNDRKKGGLAATPALANAQLQLQAQAQMRADFHEALRSRVQYVVEAAVGGFMARDVVRQLRQCCEHSTPLADRGASASAGIRPDFPLQHWQDALRSYRALHTCLLTDGASDPASCMFMRKE
jgi:hypothetical protein